MQSTLTTDEFKKRLMELTRVGYPGIMGTPFSIFLIFDFSDRKFYGTIDGSDFNITSNAVFSFSGHIIKGHVKDTGTRLADIAYTVKPIAFSYYWIRMIPLIGFLAFNTLFFYFKVQVISVVLVCNLFIGGMLALAIYREKQKRKELENLFIKLLFLEEY
jgi:hypothetical protein